jgi:hypothetical protein
VEIGTVKADSLKAEAEEILGNGRIQIEELNKKYSQGRARALSNLDSAREDWPASSNKENQD